MNFMNLQECNNWIAHLCSDREVAVTDESLAGLMSPAMAEHWLSLPAKRQTVYRCLVFSNVHEILSYVFRQTSRFLGDEKFGLSLRRFLAEFKMHSEHFYNIPRDFWDFAQMAKIFSGSAFAFLEELADYEYARWSLYQKPNLHFAAPTRLETPLTEAKLVFNPDLVLKNYQWCVDKVSTTFAPADVKPQNCFLLLYRTPDECLVETFGLNALSFAFLNSCLQNPQKSLGALLEDFSATQNDLPQDWISDLLPFLQELLRRKIVLAMG